MSRYIVNMMGGILLLSSSLFPAYAEKNSTISDLFQLNMQELANLKVTSVSSREENAAHAAGKVYIITAENIRRSGATSLPEVLRGVPGIQVSRTDSGRWRISVRGSNEAFTNKLFVSIDGRSVFTPLFSGVYWDTQNPPMEDIERIEIAGSNHGTNAVNGVINIITKKAAHTQGSYLSLLSGSNENHKGYIRHGGKLKNNGYYRLYAQNFDNDATENTNGESIGEKWSMSQTGFRVDYEPNNANDLTIQGDLYYGVKSGNFTLPILNTPYSETVNRDEDLTGGNILSRWNYHHNNNSETILQSYFDFTRRNHITLEQGIYTYDIDYQHHWQKGELHEVSIGGGYRLIYDYLDGTIYNHYPIDNSDIKHTLSTFVQDKISLIPETLSLTLASKFEYNSYTGFEIQPTTRIAWRASDNQTFWGAVSRRVRTPSRAERDIKLVVGNLEPGLITWNGNRDLESEELVSFELGYKSTPTPNLAFDVVGFANNYDNLRTTERGAIFSDNSNYQGFESFNNLPFTFGNKGSGEVFGIEVSGGWNITKDWTLSANYSLLKMNIHVDKGSADTTLENDEGESAENHFNFSSTLDLPHNIEWDNHFYFVDNLTALNIPAYIRFDSRIAWRPYDNLELSVVGQNLLNDAHSETSAPQFGQQSETGPSFYGKISYEF